MINVIPAGEKYHYLAFNAQNNPSMRRRIKFIKRMENLQLDEIVFEKDT